MHIKLTTFYLIFFFHIKYGTVAVKITYKTPRIYLTLCTLYYNFKKIEFFVSMYTVSQLTALLLFKFYTLKKKKLKKSTPRFFFLIPFDRLVLYFM